MIYNNPVIKSASSVIDDFVTNIGTGLDTKGCTAGAVKRFGDSLVITGGTGMMPGYRSIISYGAVSGGGFTSGVDCSGAFQDAVDDAVDNDIIFVPGGDYRCLSTIVWRSDIRLHLECNGDLYFGNQTGFIFPASGRTNVIKFRGRLNGTDQSGTPNYTGLTNAGIWIQCVNCLFELNMVHGFEDAVRIGGYATGTSTVQGAQYNTVRFQWLWRNKRGIHISPRGGTTNSNGNWSNENAFYGGQISGTIGVEFTRDTTQGDMFNGSKFFNIGFEFAGGGTPMTTGIIAEFCNSNEWYGGRFEPNGVTTPISFATDVDAMIFQGWMFYLNWLTNAGNAINITGQLYEVVAGRPAGFMAQGYNADSGAFLNQRVRVFGTKRSPSVCTNIPANIDVEYTNAVTENAIYSAGTFAVNKGIKNVVSNASGANTITTAIATNVPDWEITIVNVHATGTIAFNGFTVPALSSWTFQAMSGTWRIKSKG